MICEKCKKNPATVHMAQIINNEKIEKHLCTDCAAEIGFENPISFQDIFQGLLNITGNQPQIFKEEQYTNPNIKCSNCGLTYDGLIKTGKLGCSSCYQAFKPQLDITLKSIHGSNIHKGKLPRKSGGTILIKRQKDYLKRRLAIAISEERFEEAAKLRDEIKVLEKEA